jgi:hypothetical protein
MDSIGNHSTEKPNFVRSGTGMLHPPTARSQDPALFIPCLYLLPLVTFDGREDTSIHLERR